MLDFTKPKNIKCWIEDFRNDILNNTENKELHEICTILSLNEIPYFIGGSFLFGYNDCRSDIDVFFLHSNLEYDDLDKIVENYGFEFIEITGGYDSNLSIWDNCDKSIQLIGVQNNFTFFNNFKEHFVIKYLLNENPDIVNIIKEFKNSMFNVLSEKVPSEELYFLLHRFITKNKELCTKLENLIQYDVYGLDMPF
jgi:hypothetical protein